MHSHGSKNSKRNMHGNVWVAQWLVQCLTSAWVMISQLVSLSPASNFFFFFFLEQFYKWIAYFGFSITLSLYPFPAHTLSLKNKQTLKIHMEGRVSLPELLSTPAPLLLHGKHGYWLAMPPSSWHLYLQMKANVNVCSFSSLLFLHKS